MSQRIDLLPTTAYFRFLDTVSEGRQADTHAALLRINNRAQRYYVKCYGPHAKPLFNEIAGFLLADAAALPQAKSAALITLPGDFLNRLHPGRGFDTAAHWLCWATTAITHADGSRAPSATTHFNGHLASIADDLKQWKHLPGLLAFDEWVANIDRNTGNLLRLSASDYAVIDHGAILTGPDWISDLLAPIASYTNKLWMLLRSARGMPLPISNGAVHAARRFTDAYLQCAPEIRAFGNELLLADDLSTCDTFFKDRSLATPRYLKTRLGVLV